jgi:hypothetical protein
MTLQTKEKEVDIPVINVRRLSNLLSKFAPYTARLRKNIWLNEVLSIFGMSRHDDQIRKCRATYIT